jgi:protein-S-isoprenylcysteine O-methyltransferase Ste14
MNVLRTVIGVAWVAFWIYWLVSAVGVKRSAGRPGRARRRLPVGLAIILILVVTHVFGVGGAAVHSPLVEAIGAVLFASGIALAVWARVYLGRNWGMPMTEKADPELVTSGPYRFVRHPIYSGVLLAGFGTALATNLLGLIIVASAGVYFCYSATVEERNLSSVFPTAYPAYRAATKMLIPFVL